MAPAFFPPLTNASSDQQDPSLVGFIGNGGAFMYQGEYPTTESYTNAINTWVNAAPQVVQEGTKAQDWLYPVTQGFYMT